MGNEERGVIRVAVVDDDEILLHGVRSWLAQSSRNPDGTTDGLDVEVVATARSVAELLDLSGPAAASRPPSAQPHNGGRWYSADAAATTNGVAPRNNGMPRPVDPARGPTAPYRSRSAQPGNPDPARTSQHAPVALLDLRLRDGRRVAENVRTLIQAGYAVVTCSTIDDAGLVHEAGRAGALSYVRKSRDPGEMRQALAAAARGERHVSPSHAALIQRARTYGVPELSGQEREALRLYASGLTMSSVARRLNVKQGTAKSYLDRVRDKYEHAGRAARTKLELRDRAVEDGVLNSPRLE
jgi:two-component system nitrate/nitrite response regulator NarL